MSSSTMATSKTPSTNLSDTTSGSGRATTRQTAPPVAHLTVAERAARGKAARSEVPRSSHAIFQAAAHRDPIELLQRQAQTRVPELVPIRYGRMLVSPFTFYRGAALIMAAGPASTARSSGSPPPTPSRTIATTGLSPRPSRRARSPPKPGSKTDQGDPDVLRTGSSARGVSAGVGHVAADVTVSWS